MDDLRFQEAIRKRDNGQPLQAYDELRSMLHVATEADEKFALLLNMANCKTFMESPDEARALLDQARSCLPAPERIPRLHADFLEAAIFALSRQYQEAANAFSALLVNYSDVLTAPEHEDLHDDVRQRLGFALVAARQFEAGIPILEDLLRRGTGEQQRVQLYLGIAYSFLRACNDDAKCAFLAASNGPDAELTTEAQCRSGILEFQSQNFKAADEFFARVIRDGPSGSEWRRIALDYLRRKEIENLSPQA